MRVSKSITRLLSIAIVAFVAIFFSCNESSLQVGSNFLPDDHEMKTGSIKFGLGSIEDRIISSRHYYSDRINMANQSYVMFGAQYDENFGKRLSGFYTQYIPNYSLDEDEVFGYEPILDSVAFYFTINAYGGDTTIVNKFAVYEILNDDFLGDYDSTDDDDYLVYDTQSALDALSASGVLSEQLFTFNFPDKDNDVYLDSSYVILKEMSDAGQDLMDRLMLISGDYDYEIYNGTSTDFIEAFKGLYICPADDTPLDTSGGSDGATYNISVASGGIAFYGRNKYEDDPLLIQDTIMMSYSSYNS